MPIYEYQCESCDRRTEVIQRISDPPLVTCDECGGDLRKLISAPAFQFKGSGWYVTDYARKGDGGEGKGKEKDAAADKAADGGKSSGDSGKGSGDSASEASSSSSSSSREGFTKPERLAAAQLHARDSA
jgi:putative FmdB family regulatory protein